jgi:hypothetical protein
VPLMRCFECGREISEYADACPGCGYVLDSRPDENASDERIEYWLWKCTGWKWRVVGRDSLDPERALVLTQDILEARPFEDGTGEAISWETSALRKYLNGPFFSGLPAKVRERVVRINHDGDRDSDGDHVFLLSEHEVETYLKGVDCCAGVEDDEDKVDSSEQYEEDRSASPLEEWEADSRQYSKSTYDEWEEEHDSVLEREHAYQAEWEAVYGQDERERLDRDWLNTCWWLRNMGHDPDDDPDDVQAKASVCDYDMRRFRSRHRRSDHLFEPTELLGDVECVSCGAREYHPPRYRSSPTSELLGVRVALCVDVSSYPNPNWSSSDVKPDWRPGPVDIAF